jgi:hypothetical protein
VWKSRCNGQQRRYFEAAIWHSGKLKALNIVVFNAGLNEEDIVESATGMTPILPLDGVHWRMMGFKCKAHHAPRISESVDQWILQLNRTNAQARVG